LLAGEIANLHWWLDKKAADGATDHTLQPFRDKVNALLGKYQRGREYFDCSHVEFVDEDYDYGDLWPDFYFCRED